MINQFESLSYTARFMALKAGLAELLNIDILKLNQATHFLECGSSIDHAIGKAGLVSDMKRLKAERTRADYEFWFDAMRLIKAYGNESTWTFYNRELNRLRANWKPSLAIRQAHESFNLAKYGSLFVWKTKGLTSHGKKSIALIGRIAANIRAENN